MKTCILALLLAFDTAFAATEENISTNFPAAPGGILIVDINFGGIDVDTNLTSGQISVKVWRKITRKTEADEKRFLLNHPVQFVTKENTLKILCKGPHEMIRGNDRNEATYTLRVPPKFNCELDTAGGGISLANVTGSSSANTSGGPLRFASLTGPLNGNTSGGDIRVLDCNGAEYIRTSGGRIEVSASGGTLRAKTSGGNVTVHTFNGPAALETDGGSIALSNINGKLKASTSGGPVSLDLIAPVPGEVSLSTSGGPVTVNTPAQAAFNLDAHTSGGHVSCELPITVQGNPESDRLRGTINGGGPDLVLRSGGGEIRVNKSAMATAIER
jgi:hypothetical protein